MQGSDIDGEKSPKRKRRPIKGEFLESMSMRDWAAALGMSKSEVHRCIQLAAIPKDEFEQLLMVQPKNRATSSMRSILSEYAKSLSPHGDRIASAKVARCPTCGRRYG